MPEEQPTRPTEEDERRALLWLTDMREHGGPLSRRYAASIIQTLAYFEFALNEAPAGDLTRASDQA